MKLRIILPLTLIITLLSIMAASCAQPRRERNGRDERDRYVEYSGTVTNLNRSSLDFTLRDGRQTHRVEAIRAAIQLSSGKRGGLYDVQEGALVRVSGTLISGNVLKADTVVVISEPQRPGYDQSYKYRPNQESNIDGYVTKVNARANQIHIRSGSKDYVVDINSRTGITRNARSLGISDIRNSDHVSITGEMRGSGRIDAQRVQILDLDRSKDGWNRNLGNTVEGTITGAASFFDRSIVIKTQYGDKRLDVPKDADITRDNREISIHSLNKGDWVRAYGSWDGDTLVANRITASSDGYRGDRWSKEKPTKYVPNSRPADISQTQTGEIVTIDYRRQEMTVDTGRNVIRVDAKNADLIYRSKAVDFDQIEKGDRVDITGTFTDNTLRAQSIEVVS